MSNNKQEIIKRIEEITEEIGLTSNSVGGGQCFPARFIRANSSETNID